MISFLAQAAREARRAAGIKNARVAVAADLDPSTIYRFERGNWPGNADQVVAGYAEELELEPIKLWERALELWREELAGEAISESSASGARAVDEVAARLQAEAGSRPSKASGAPASRRGAPRRRRA